MSLGERVHKLEHDQAQTRKEVRKVRAANGLGPEDEDILSWVGKRVVLVPATAGRSEEEGVLKKIRRYTYLVETDGGLEAFNKGQVLKIRLAG